MEEFGIKEWLGMYKIYKKEFWRLIAAMVIFIISMVLFLNRDTSEKNDYDSRDFFSAAILEYEEMTGKKIYPTGREFLQRAMERDKLTSKEQVLELIRANEKYMWKNP